MYFFNRDVLKTLASENIFLSPQEIQRYIADIEQAERENRGLKTKKNPQENRRFSLWHSPASTFNKGVSSHYLILSAPENWKTKGEEDKTITTKIFVDCLSGEKKFVKIRRPETLKQEFHLHDSLHEAKNNEILDVLVDHYTRLSPGKGTKAYLFQPYRGKMNGHDFLFQPTTSSQELMKFLLDSAYLLEKLHAKGFIHGDFKPHNLVLSEDKKEIHFVDLESLLSFEKGQKGLRKLYGTPAFCHPAWVQQTKQNLDQGGLAYYSPANDIYAFLVMAEAFLNQAQSRETRPHEKKSLIDALSQISAWKQSPWHTIPSMSVVTARLKMLTQPQYPSQPAPVYYQNQKPPLPMQAQPAPIYYQNQKPPVPIQAQPAPIYYQNQKPPLPMQTQPAPIYYQNQKPPLPMQTQPAPMYYQKPSVPLQPQGAPVQFYYRAVAPMGVFSKPLGVVSNTAPVILQAPPRRVLFKF